VVVGLKRDSAFWPRKMLIRAPVAGRVTRASASTKLKAVHGWRRCINRQRSFAALVLRPPITTATCTKQKMDDVELPPLPSSRALARRSSASLPSRKRPRLDYEPESSNSSDPALFSSDDPAPSAEHYSAKRRKDKWHGTWWGGRLRSTPRREVRQLKRNYDSGIWMGSEGTESSLEEEFLNDQRDMLAKETIFSDSVKQQANSNTLSEPSLAVAGRRGVIGDDGQAVPRVANPHIAPEKTHLSRARALVQACVDAGAEDVDLS
jgi:hypothetical protein